ncbi:hydrogenobyrinate a,c-diamide synthase [Pseudosulfitobacter pseudonitzschiae]|uniref:Hydrogenobyrinate a,c-diamide synthase n=1 Tax=Pseudosulfitobacter pseudonitzschiae TaxID=1402135 RepID=A0A221K3K8_9RHOB|nr:cobyrinate a,c-diamide synthase [Pseudosulfitobacter pseudonitzschiae]ASM73588.1 hydrogenobyrinate a,c-diamide synthase [Pseudosulfitobacter pseudonitzschiae]
MTDAPGLLISAPASGTGKTTVMLGLLRALAQDGLTVQAFKSGPDYIDPAFHRAASGRMSFNIDTWTMGAGLLGAIAAQATGADICIAEGSMGLYDSVATRGQSGFGASAETAALMGWPVVLVVDVSGQAQSAAAVTLGFKLYNPDLPFAGVILNRVASARHERLARLGMEKAGLTVFGALPRQGDLTLPERHLGLVQAAEHPDLVWLPGGYPELHAGRLAAAQTFAKGLREHARTRPVHGECGGYMALGQALIDKEGNRHRMAGLLGLVSSYETRKFHLGYRQATLRAAMAGHAKGARLRGHEFHYSTIIEQPDTPLADVADADGVPVPETGSCRGTVTGTFFHLVTAEQD